MRAKAILDNRKIPALVLINYIQFVFCQDIGSLVVKIVTEFSIEREETGVCNDAFNFSLDQNGKRCVQLAQFVSKHGYYQCPILSEEKVHVNNPPVAHCSMKARDEIGENIH